LILRRNAAGLIWSAIGKSADRNIRVARFHWNPVRAHPVMICTNRVSKLPDAGSRKRGPACCLHPCNWPMLGVKDLPRSCPPCSFCCPHRADLAIGIDGDLTFRVPVLNLSEHLARSAWSCSSAGIQSRQDHAWRTEFPNCLIVDEVRNVRMVAPDAGSR